MRSREHGSGSGYEAEGFLQDRDGSDNLHGDRVAGFGVNANAHRTFRTTRATGVARASPTSDQS